MTKNMPITVSIVEDHPKTREALVMRVNRAPSLRCLSTYANAELALKGIPTEKPNVVLVDINLPGMSGIECVAKLKALLPQLPMLMITTYEETELIFNSLRAGAKGYLLKNARKVVDHFCRQKPASEVDQLSKREEEVLALLAKGRLYKEIGDTLNISI